MAMTTMLEVPVPPLPSVQGEEEVVLPGYEAGIEQSGVEHSRRKLEESADRLSAKLAAIDDRSQSRLRLQSHCPPGQEGGFGERRCITSVGGSSSSSSIIQTLQCHSEEETWTYRCRCNFQIVTLVEALPTTATDTTASTAPNSFPSPLQSHRYAYAMRSRGRPVLLGTKNSFPIATRRIQTAMGEFMEYLNSNTNTNNSNSNNGEIENGNIIGVHLTSCTFSSAWRDTPDADCVLTLHYDHPLGNHKTFWKQQARDLCQRLNLRQLNGRSKGTLLSVRGEAKERGNYRITTNNKSNNSNDHDHDSNSENGKSSNTDDEAEATIRDTVHLLRSNCGSSNDNDNDNETNNGTITEGVVEWKVGLEEEISPPDVKAALLSIIPVRYDKPETAFYHPNPNAMTKALAWMLNRLTSILSSSSSSLNRQQGRLKLLEMYCGCGAHTVALGRSGLISSILAVELDPRLVRACEINVFNNGLQEVVEIRKGDAGKWAREESRRSRLRSRRQRQMRTEITEEKDQNNCDDNHGNYDVLLVDPPRQGLDEEVCRMAMMSLERSSDEDDEKADDNGDRNSSCFRNILYVSCGHQALLRDLERLSPVYEVVNCAQMDLFPRTDSIETLVHLRKRGL